MQDPHVVSLKYRAAVAPGADYKKAPPLQHETATFRIRLDAQEVTATMLEHYPSVEAAREVVEPSLRAWEIQQALDLGTTEIRFEFENAEIIDRRPPPPGAYHLAASAGVFLAKVGVHAQGHVGRAKYPAFPEKFRSCPELETIWRRYEGYCEGREPLASMAYFCLTVIESRAGDRKKAAIRYGICKKVLDVLGDLTANRGDRLTARKVKKGSTLTALTPREEEWIRAAVRLIARRVGERAFDESAASRQLTMADLPKLPKSHRQT